MWKARIYLLQDSFLFSLYKQIELRKGNIFKKNYELSLEF